MQQFWKIYNTVKHDKYYGCIALSLFCLFIGYFNIASWHSTVIGVVLTIVYFALNSAWLSVILARLFKWTRGWAVLFALFLLPNGISLLLAIPVDLFRYSTGSLLFVLFATTVVVRGLLFFPHFKDFDCEEKDESLDDPLRKTYEPNKYLVLALPFLVVLGVWFLLSARTGEFILSPWSVIPRLYLYVYLVITAGIALLLFSKRNAKLLLVAIILHSFLLHSYLPLVYETGFGGDKWRHLASENLIRTGAVYQPALIGDVEYARLGPFELPAVLVTGNKTSYGHQWSLTLMFSEMLQIDVFWIDFWAIFFMWSLFLPLLLYRLALFIRPGRQFALLFAFLPALFYPMHVFGAITLPVSLGHLLFVFMVVAWLQYYREQRPWLLTFNLGMSLLMYFGYILHFLIIWEFAVLILLMTAFKKFKVRTGVRQIVVMAFVLVSIAFIPFLETLQGFGSVKDEVKSFTGGFSALADAFGHLSGLVAFLPQSGHVDQGNFLFNQTRADHAPVSFLSFRMWPLLFTVLIWLVIALGYRVVGWLKRPKVPRLFVYMSVIVLGNYIVSWYFLNGNHILARRLDQIIVLFLSIFLGLGIMYFVERTEYLPWATKVLLVGIVLAFISSSTYASGPFLQVVTADEHRAAQYVWERIDKSDEYYCMVANTWPLLAVEAESGRAIIGGGFPVGFEYAQPERVKIFEKMSQHPDKEWLDWALEITRDDSCYFMQEDRWINDRVYKETIELLGEPEQIIGDVFIWKYQP